MVMRPLTEVMADAIAERFLDRAEVAALGSALARSLERECEHKKFYLAAESWYHRMFEGVRKALGDLYDYDIVEDVRRVVRLARGGRDARNGSDPATGRRP